MITSFEAEMQELHAHRVGNKFNDEYVALSDKPVNIDDDLFKAIMMSYLLKPFEKVNSIYRFYHPSGDVRQNDIFHIIRDFFAAPEYSCECSEMIARHLYASSNHPKIKAGEVYIAHFLAVQIEGELHEAIGIFKSENKETYLKINPELGINYEQDAINIQKLDRGCLIFNTEEEKGYKVAVIDNSKESYWKDDFLNLEIRNDSFTQTSNMMNLVKGFINDELDNSFELSKMDKSDLLNKSLQYFKEKETFDVEEFAGDVIGNDVAFEDFKKYKSNYDEQFYAIPENFVISEPAVKKQVKAFKSVIALDKNFHLYVHGNKDLIEKGFDDDKGLNFYKVYFKEEK
jgi:hypothetical protein